MLPQGREKSALKSLRSRAAARMTRCSVKANENSTAIVVGPLDVLSNCSHFARNEGRANAIGSNSIFVIICLVELVPALTQAKPLSAVPDLVLFTVVGKPVPLEPLFLQNKVRRPAHKSHRLQDGAQRFPYRGIGDRSYQDKLGLLVNVVSLRVSPGLRDWR